MNTEQFGRALVTSGDLDPIYLMLNSSRLDAATLARWCLAYWCYYHAGVASKVAEAPSDEFWTLMWKAQNEKWPRGTERRHFKAAAADKALVHLMTRYPTPEDAVASLASYGNWDELLASEMPVPIPFARVAHSAQSWVGFGPWIAFKIADMLDAVIGVRVVFPGDASVWFEDPIKGAVWSQIIETGPFLTTPGYREEAFKTMPPATRQLEARKAIARLLPLFSDTRGPDGRGVRVQELETILCKYKSHLNGRYPMGKDTREILHGLTGWGDLAHQLQKALKGTTPKEHHV